MTMNPWIHHSMNHANIKFGKDINKNRTAVVGFRLLLFIQFMYFVFTTNHLPFAFRWPTFADPNWPYIRIEFDCQLHNSIFHITNIVFEEFLRTLHHNFAFHKKTKSIQSERESERENLRKSRVEFVKNKNSHKNTKTKSLSIWLMI